MGIAFFEIRCIISANFMDKLLKIATYYMDIFYGLK